MIHTLPFEIQQKIYEYDPTYRDLFNELLDELTNDGELTTIARCIEDSGIELKWIKYYDGFYYSDQGSVELMSYDEYEELQANCLSKGDEYLIAEYCDLTASDIDKIQARLPEDLCFNIFRQIIPEGEFVELLDRLSNIICKIDYDDDLIVIRDV